MIETMALLHLVLLQAQQKKAEINRLPEKIILSEVRRMVDEMQNLNKQIENTVGLLLTET